MDENGSIEVDSEVDEIVVVNLIVGGVFYSLEREDVEHFPDSYFAHLLKSEWHRDKDTPAVIDRDGNLFRYIHNFIQNEQIDSARRPLNDFQVMMGVRHEADFYNLPALITLVDARILYYLQCSAAELTVDADLFHCTVESERPSDLLDVLNTYIRDVVMVKGTLNANDPFVNASLNLRGRQITAANFHNCFDDTYTVRRARLLALCDEFSSWPFHDDCRDDLVDLQISEERVFTYTEGGYCTSRAVPSSRLVTMRGAILFVLPCTYTGGTIRCTANGSSLSIDRPGECMAIRAGCLYSVDAVTSGTLKVLECVVWSGPCAEDITTEALKEEEEGRLRWDAPLMPTLHTTFCVDDDNAVRRVEAVGASVKEAIVGDKIGPDVHMNAKEEKNVRINVNSTNAGTGTGDGDGAGAGDSDGTGASSALLAERDLMNKFTRLVNSLIDAIDHELRTYSGVVIALTNYYPLHDTPQPQPPDGVQCTDPEALNASDRALYTLLDRYYTVIAVPISITYTDNYTTVTGRTVLIAPCSGKYKIVAPVYGYGELFQYKNGDTMVPSTIVTGLLVFG